MSHHAARSNNGPIPNIHTFENCRAGSNPNPVSNDNRTAISAPIKRVVIGVGNTYIPRYGTVTPDSDSFPAYEFGSTIYEGTLSH